MQDTLLGPGDAAVKKTGKSPCPPLLLKHKRILFFPPLFLYTVGFWLSNSDSRTFRAFSWFRVLASKPCLLSFVLSYCLSPLSLSSVLTPEVTKQILEYFLP